MFFSLPLSKKNKKKKSDYYERWPDFKIEIITWELFEFSNTEKQIEKLILFKNWNEYEHENENEYRQQNLKMGKKKENDKMKRSFI